MDQMDGEEFDLEESEDDDSTLRLVNEGNVATAAGNGDDGKGGKGKGKGKYKGKNASDVRQGAGVPPCPKY